MRRLICRLFGHRDAYGYIDHFGVADCHCDFCHCDWMEVD